MPRTVLALLIGFSALGLTAGGLVADEKKDEKFEGKLVCSKCTLGETDKCGHALKVKGKDGKETTYYVKDKGGKEKYHGKVCPADSELAVTVTGKVTEKDGKKSIEDAKVEEKK